MANWKKIVLEEDITGAGPIAVSSSAFSLTVSGLSAAGTPSGTDQLLLWNGSSWESVNASEFLGAAGAAITTFTNGVDNRVLTATGAAGANAESKLVFSASTLEVLSVNSTTSGVKINGGAVGAASPYITPSGAHTTMKFGDGISGHIYDFQQNKIAFDSDSTNTYIAANAETPEDLEIHSDQDILLAADNKTTVSSALDVTGTISAAGNISLVGEVVGGSTSSVSVIQLKKSNGAASSSGDVGVGTETYYGGSATTLQPGYFYYLNFQGGWTATSATSNTRAAHGFMGMAMESSSSKGFATKGVCRVAVDPSGAVGDPVYLSTSTGRLTSTAPSTTGNVVRVVGYKVGSNLVYLNPSPYWEVV